MLREGNTRTVLLRRPAETISTAPATNLIRAGVGGTRVALPAIKLGGSVSAVGVLDMTFTRVCGGTSREYRHQPVASSVHERGDAGGPDQLVVGGVKHLSDCRLDTATLQRPLHGIPCIIPVNRGRISSASSPGSIWSRAWFGISRSKLSTAAASSLRRPDDQDRGVHHRLKPAQSPVHLDQTRRPNPRQDQRQT